MTLNLFNMISSKVVMAELARIDRAMMMGDFCERADLSVATGETQAVLRAINGLLDQSLPQAAVLNESMNVMSTKHDEGDIDAILPVEQFKGEYAVIAKNVNRMVGAHIAVKKAAMACIREFAHGNFEATLEQLPGKKAFINETIETLRGNLKGLIAELNHMSAEHDKGDIDVIVATEKFQGDFAVMANGVNTMVAGHIAVKKKAMACVKEFGEGNFEAVLEQFPGKKAFINDTIETLRKNLRDITAEIQRLIVSATVGRLSERGDAKNFVGDFQALVSGINGMLDAIILPIAEGNRVLDRVSNGDLMEACRD